MISKFPDRFFLNAMVYPEDGEYVAHCIEMGLVGFGANPKAALNDLDDHIEMQVSFARQMNNPNLLWHPAPMGIQRIFMTMLESAVKGVIESVTNTGYRLAQLPYPTRLPKSKFKEACVQNV